MSGNYPDPFTSGLGTMCSMTCSLFPENLTKQIFTEHPDYKTFGQPDTINSKDMVYVDDQALLQTALQPDGSCSRGRCS